MYVTLISGCLCTNLYVIMLVLCEFFLKWQIWSLKHPKEDAILWYKQKPQSKHYNENVEMRLCSSYEIALFLLYIIYVEMKTLRERELSYFTIVVFGVSSLVLSFSCYSLIS